MAKKKGKSVATAQSTGLQERPDWMRNDGPARGSEEVGINDLTIPRLSIIQDLSPQRKKNNAEYIEGAEEGMLFNTVTNTLYGRSVNFVPVYFRLEWVIWRHRDAGGGFMGAFKTEEEAVEAFSGLPEAGQTTKKGEPVLSIQDTAQHFGLLLDEELGPHEIVVSMSKSQLKPSRQFNSMIRLAGGDRFERVYTLSAVEVEGAQGTYYNWKINQLGYVDKETYSRAEALYDAVSSGKRDVERGPATPAESAPETDDENM